LRPFLIAPDLAELAGRRARAEEQQDVVGV
jgi:hypothetical protein